MSEHKSTAAVPSRLPMTIAARLVLAGFASSTYPVVPEGKLLGMMGRAPTDDSLPPHETQRDQCTSGQISSDVAVD